LRASANGVVEAPEDPELLARMTAQVMPTVDPRWNDTNPAQLAQVILERGLLTDMTSMDAVIADLSTAAEIARGREAQQTLAQWQQSESSRRTKQQAQTLSGAGGRGEPADDDAEFFERLKSAHAGGNYAARRGNNV
jgi:hypothetical protein